MNGAENLHIIFDFSDTLLRSFQRSDRYWWGRGFVLADIDRSNRYQTNPPSPQEGIRWVLYNDWIY
jgi:hypothetical protein